MEIKIIDQSLSVADQVVARDLPAIAAAGYKSLICNRTDAEGPDQPAFAAIEAAAAGAGLQAAYLPIVPGAVSDDYVVQFQALLDQMPKPVLAYCRTGMRSATLWALSEGARGRTLPEILTSTKSAGYDLSGLASRIAG